MMMLVLRVRVHLLLLLLVLEILLLHYCSVVPREEITRIEIEISDSNNARHGKPKLETRL
jgi:hypothetical protein